MIGCFSKGCFICLSFYFLQVELSDSRLLYLEDEWTAVSKHSHIDILSACAMEFCLIAFGVFQCGFGQELFNGFRILLSGFGQELFNGFRILLSCEVAGLASSAFAFPAWPFCLGNVSDKLVVSSFYEDRIDLYSYLDRIFHIFFKHFSKVRHYDDVLLVEIHLLREVFL